MSGGDDGGIVSHSSEHQPSAPPLFNADSAGTDLDREASFPDEFEELKWTPLYRELFFQLSSDDTNEAKKILENLTPPATILIHCVLTNLSEFAYAVKLHGNTIVQHSTSTSTYHHGPVTSPSTNIISTDNAAPTSAKSSLAPPAATCIAPATTEDVTAQLQPKGNSHKNVASLFRRSKKKDGDKTPMLDENAIEFDNLTTLFPSQNDHTTKGAKLHSRSPSLNTDIASDATRVTPDLNNEQSKSRQKLIQSSPEISDEFTENLEAQLSSLAEDLHSNDDQYKDICVDQCEQHFLRCLKLKISAVFHACLFILYHIHYYERKKHDPTLGSPRAIKQMKRKDTQPSSSADVPQTTTLMGTHPSNSLKISACGNTPSQKRSEPEHSASSVCTDLSSRTPDPTTGEREEKTEEEVMPENRAHRRDHKQDASSKRRKKKTKKAIPVGRRHNRYYFASARENAGILGGFSSVGGAALTEHEKMGHLRTLFSDTDIIAGTERAVNRICDWIDNAARRYPRAESVLTSFRDELTNRLNNRMIKILEIMKVGNFMQAVKHQEKIIHVFSSQLTVNFSNDIRHIYVANSSLTNVLRRLEVEANSRCRWLSKAIFRDTLTPNDANDASQWILECVDFGLDLSMTGTSLSYKGSNSADPISPFATRADPNSTKGCSECVKNCAVL